MLGQILKIGKNIILIGLLVGVLVVLGNAIAILIDWNWLTYFFVIIRQLLTLIDWLFPTSVLITLMGITFGVHLALWGYKATWFVIRWFREH